MDINFVYRKKTIIIAVLIVLLIVIGLLYLLLSDQRIENEANNVPVEPAQVQQQARDVIGLEEVPTLPVEQGGGLDIESPEIKASQEAVEKLRGSLPYYHTFVSSGGIEVEVSIPPIETLANDWTIQIDIFGPDYQVPEDDPSYPAMKQAFLEGAGNALQFITEQDVDLDEVIIQWGDRAIIAERSAEWLSKE